jgi:hypothetical protein
LLVAGRAGDAAAVLGVLALAVALREVVLAARDTVPGANATAEALAEHLAEVLQRAFGDFVVAAAVDLTAARRLLEFDCAAW